MNLKSLKKKLFKYKCSNLLIILGVGLFLRLFYLIQKTGNIFLPNLGGDTCYHYNIAYNIATGIGPKTNFIFSYWFYHDKIPALTDLYGPGYHYFLSLFLLMKDEFILLRFSSLLVGLTSILLAFFLGKIIHSKKLGYISAIIICFNFFHIENSTVVMREMFSLLLVQLFFLNLFIIKKNNLFFCSIGIIIGYSALTIGGWIILFFIFLFYILLVLNKNLKLILNFLSFSIFFFLVIFSWSNTSYQYFGKFLFNLTSYYPYIPDWGNMMFEIGLPDMDNFWKKINLYEYLQKHFIWGLKNFIKFHLAVFPTFAFPLSFVLLPAIFLATCKLRFKGLILLIFLIFYFFGLLFGSYALQGTLWPRHFLILLAPTSILLGYGLILIYDQCFKYNILKEVILFLFKFRVVVCIIPILITIIGIQTKPSFWERDSSHFYNFGEKIKKVTKENDTIMLASTVSDGWCATRRNFVQDIAFYDNPNYKHRIKQEVEKYKVNYLLIDLSDHIYQRGGRSIEKVIMSYSNLNLIEILKDEANGYYFYKIKN
jgi:hypothetical protein